MGWTNTLPCGSGLELMPLIELRAVFTCRTTDLDAELSNAAGVPNFFGMALLAGKVYAGLVGDVTLAFTPTGCELLASGLEFACGCGDGVFAGGA